MKIQLSEKFGYIKLLRFTLPSIAMMIFTSLYGIVDGWFVSNIVGHEAFVSVNLIWPLFMVLSSAGFMLGTGGSALVSRTLGEGKREQAKKYFSMLVYVLIFIGVLVTVVGLIFVRPISYLMGADETLIDDCVIYGRILFLSFIPFILQNAFQSFFVVAERPKIGFSISLVSGFTNIFLDFLLIYVFEFGIKGAAIATAFSQTVGGLFPLLYFSFKNSSSLRIVATKIYLKPLIKSCLNGSSEMLTTMATSLINMLFNIQLMKLYGSDGVAAFGVIMYSSFVFSSAYLGYSMGVAPIISYHFGARNKEELKSLLKKSLIILAVAAIAILVVSEFAAKGIVSIFVSYSDDLLNLTTYAQRIFAISFLLMGFNIFSSAFFTALSNGVISAIISFLRTLVFQILLLLLLPEILGKEGIWFAVPVAELLASIVTIICFIANKKKYGY